MTLGPTRTDVFKQLLQSRERNDVLPEADNFRSEKLLTPVHTVQFWKLNRSSQLGKSQVNP